MHRVRPGSVFRGVQRLSAILSSLCEFLAAGLRPRTHLAKAIVLVLVIKLIGLTGMSLWMLARGQPAIDAAAMGRLLAASPPTP